MQHPKSSLVLEPSPNIDARDVMVAVSEAFGMFIELVGGGS